MDIPASFHNTSGKVSLSASDEIDDLVGEPLEGSGFEAQDPELGFEFDWSGLPLRTERGDQ